MLPTTRKQAIIDDEKYYYNGKLCKKGHLAKRFSHNGVCYDCVIESNKNWYDKNKTDVEWRKKRLFNHLKKRAIGKNVPFDIEFSDIIWPESCPVFGYVLEYDNSDKPKHNSASIDKVIPELGYVKGNVRVISYRANWLKQDSTVEELESIIRYMKGNV
ncbi:MAG: hypothetical protein EB127_17895 [Alphaproteobacteria bacterium]|nr:hypothetical protein [Alphaproteobacteria bacterium]